jgi:hypothetical protein
MTLPVKIVAADLQAGWAGRDRVGSRLLKPLGPLAAQRAQV